MASFAGIVIIMNTQNFDKEMIVSRRSTYQKILALEKEGAQVLERDSDLPVDIIISSAICLVWYDYSNIGKKATTQDEASSGLPSCIENIATNVLTSLSFTFSSCILVFEGDASFLITVMESSDGLYAAASSLGLKLQLFCSYSSELTDEIILSSICCSSKLTRGLYPKMPESETLAESFLTKFPSINPLTAHAILSSGGMLIEFLGWSHERRVSAIEKYHVPDESVTLLSALCRYGEREDTKSILTDSSSVSSGPDSENCHGKVDSERKRQKVVRSPRNIDRSVDDILHFQPVNQLSDGVLKPSEVSKQSTSWMLKDLEIFNEMEKPSFSLNDFSGQKWGSDNRMMMSRSRVPNMFNSQISNGIQEHHFPLNDKMLCQDQGLDMMNNLGCSRTKNSENQLDDLKGEVIDLTGSPILGEDFSSSANSMNFSPLVPEMEKDSTRKPKIVRKLSFGQSSRPTFPMAAEINSGSETWNYVKKQSLEGGTDECPDANLCINRLPLRHREKLFEEGLTQRCAENFQGMPFQEPEPLQYSGTPLSNAIHSTHLPRGSPWTIEFLNRIREKSRMRQQSLPRHPSSPCFDHSRNVSKLTKRKSPSILDFFKYQGGRTTKKTADSKRQKHDMQSSSSSRKEKTSDSLFTSWTPADKRARQTLSFAMNESGSQTKLVWSEGKGHVLNKNFENQI